MNLRRALLALFVACAANLAVAAPAFTPLLADQGTLPLHLTAPTDVAKALAVPRKGLPIQFAVSVPLALGLEGGRWQALDNDTLVWRTRLQSLGAKSLNLEFSRFHLPEGAALWLYDPAGTLVQGPYTHANENADGTLWTALVPGETLVMELRVPQAQAAAVDLKLLRVHHAFQSFELAAAAPSKSGSCNIDVICPQGDDWRDEIRAVARISIGGNLLCSAQMMNNVRQNSDPLLLTADHCGIGDADGGPPSSVVAYWNYQTSSCGGTPDGHLTQNQTGSTKLADDVSSDFTLVRLLQSPNASWNVYFAGFSAVKAIPQSGIAIHHPNGDEKRLSVYSDPATRTQVDIGEGRTVDAWRVHWTAGTTEPGSSGGGLWNQDHELVGVLSGGEASCSNTGGPDYFARLEEAWQAQSAKAHQLKAWLDPDGTGCADLPGRDAGDTPVSVSDCTKISGGSGGGGSGSSSGGGGGHSGSGAFLGALPPGVLWIAVLLRVALRRRTI